jgi:hypothetical protein
LTVNDLASAVLKLLGSAKVSVSNNDWNNFDFGDPDDLNLSTLSDYRHGDKVLT